jgi:hypothetical protein
MRDDVVGVLDKLDLAQLTLVGHSMGGVVAYLIAEEQPGRISRLVLEDTPPPFPRERAAPERPAAPLPFDWAVVPAICAQLNSPDPAWRERLTEITAPTLIVAGGSTSHIPQEKLAEAAVRIPRCTMETIPARFFRAGRRPRWRGPGTARRPRADRPGDRAPAGRRSAMAGADLCALVRPGLRGLSAGPSRRIRRQRGPNPGSAMAHVPGGAEHLVHSFPDDLENDPQVRFLGTAHDSLAPVDA